MINELLTIANFILDAFRHIWPYLLITIPLAVVARMSGASKYISKVFRARPLIAIILATVVGAFSPFCSCGVVPVIAALLLGGVPLAPVMSFWIASPSMDPEIFFLSVATIGWELALWRLGGTLVLSLAAGFLTHFIMKQKWIGQEILRNKGTSLTQDLKMRVKAGWGNLKKRLNASLPASFPLDSAPLTPVPVCCSEAAIAGPFPAPGIIKELTSNVAPRLGNQELGGCGISTQEGECAVESRPFRDRVIKETWDATTMVIKFMLLAFFLEALIELYIPAEWISGLLGKSFLKG
jgi:uncharacterized membrane protein YraQ (UPF0718 family)